jgi:acetylornithine/succinyldiaminopimelate/putrescine aminotransferase
MNSGAEAIEGALKLARKATGRHGFVSFEGAYHGDTFGALSLAGSELYRRPFEPLLGPVRRLPFGDERGLAAIDETVAAVVVEPVQGEGGVRIPPPHFLPAVEARCRAVGALLVADEVLTGFGRTGRFLAVEHWGVTPDVIVLAKALGGGFPLGAFVASRERMQVLAVDPALSHLTTFGGHPVSCAAGRAALRVLQTEGLCERALRVGRWLLEGLETAFAGRNEVREVRGLGMLLGIELESAARAKDFVQGCRERGILVGWTLHHDHIVRLAPPLITPESVLADAVRTMTAVLAGC